MGSILPPLHGVAEHANQAMTTSTATPKSVSPSATSSTTFLASSGATVSSSFVGRALHISVRIAYSLGLIASALIGLLWYFQEKLLFHPRAPQGFETPDKNPHPFQNPGQMGMAYEDVHIKSTEGCTIHAWFIKQKSPHEYKTLPTMIFFQGNAGNMGFRLANLLRLYQQCRVNIFAVSYRGYGFSTGTPSEHGVYADAEAALDYLLSRNDVEKNRIVIFGRSIGGAVAIDLAARRSAHVRAVIVENTFTSLREMVDIVFPFLRYVSAVVALAQRLFMDSLSKIASLSVPVMFISGLQDALVPPSQVARLYNASTASPLRYLYPVANGTHNDTWQQAGTQYYLEIFNFITRALAIPTKDVKQKTDPHPPAAEAVDKTTDASLRNKHNQPPSVKEAADVSNIQLHPPLSVPHQPSEATLAFGSSSQGETEARNRRTAAVVERAEL